MVNSQICKLCIVIGINTSTYHRRLFNFVLVTILVVPFGLDFHDVQELYEMWTHQTKAHLCAMCISVSNELGSTENSGVLLDVGFLLCIVDIQV